MIPKILAKDDFFKLGLDLGSQHREAYINFMLKGFPNCRSRDYAVEWADRFKIGTHWACADKKRKVILREVYGVDK